MGLVLLIVQLLCGFQSITLEGTRHFHSKVTEVYSCPINTHHLQNDYTFHIIIEIASYCTVAIP